MKTTKDYTLHLICGMILFAALFSCNQEKREIEDPDISIIDIRGCEYIRTHVYMGCLVTHLSNCKNHNNKYTLIQSNSPHMSNYHPEIDLISNDSIYVN